MVVLRRTPNQAIWKPTKGHIREKNHMFAHGKDAVGNSHEVMNWQDITENTQVIGHFNVGCVNEHSPGQIICHCIWNDIWQCDLTKFLFCFIRNENGKTLKEVGWMEVLIYDERRPVSSVERRSSCLLYTVYALTMGHKSIWSRIRFPMLMSFLWHIFWFFHNFTTSRKGMIRIAEGLMGL